MTRRLTTPLFVLAPIIMLCLPALAQTVPGLEITDLVPDAVQYPKGPSVTVRIRTHPGVLEAWVIRHLDGAIVRKYQVPPGDRWRQELEVTEPTNDRLPGLVKGTHVRVPFTLALLDTNYVVQNSRAFVVQVSSSRKGWDTAWFKSELPVMAHIAAGEFTSVENDQLVVKTLRDKPADKFLIDSDTKVLMWDPHGPSPGDPVNILYTEREGKTVATEVLVGQWGSANWEQIFLASARSLTKLTGLQFSMADLRFQIGRVSRVTNVSPDPSQLGPDVIVEVKTPHGSTEWVVTQETEVLSGLAKVSLGQIRTEILVAVGTDKLEGVPFPARRIILLQDLSSTR